MDTHVGKKRALPWQMLDSEQLGCLWEQAVSAVQLAGRGQQDASCSRSTQPAAAAVTGVLCLQQQERHHQRQRLVATRSCA
jgi:hypothetical protein